MLKIKIAIGNYDDLSNNIEEKPMARQGQRINMTT